MPDVADPVLLVTALVFVSATLLTLVSLWAFEHSGRRRRRFNDFSVASSGAPVATGGGAS